MEGGGVKALNFGKIEDWGIFEGEKAGVYS